MINNKGIITDLLGSAYTRIHILLVIFICFSHLPAIAGDEKNLEQVEDSILRVMDVMPRDTDYLKKITSLEQLFLNSPKFLYYAELKEKEAKKQSRPDFVCGSMSDRAIYYANKGNIDSFYYWKSRMDTLALQIKDYNYYFFLWRREVTLLIYGGQIEKAIRTAHDMYNTAQKLNSNEGFIASNMSIGEAMFVAKKYYQALSSYEIALSLIPPDQERWRAWKMNIYNNLTLICETIKNGEKGLEFAIQQEELINNIHKKEVGSNIQEPYLINEWANLQLKKAEFHLILKQPDKALEMLNLAKTYYPQLREGSRMFYHLKATNYFEAIREWEKALTEFNIMSPFYLENSTNFNLLEQKARLLGHTGNKSEAIKLYKQAILLKDSVNNEWFDSQLNELQTIYVTDCLKLKNNELELKNRHTQLQIALISFALTIIALILISGLYIRLSRMKKKLVNSKAQLTEEKNLLIRSQQELQAAKDKAEYAKDIALKAERKESFFANMSHEIRTPLNAIVGFSNLLASEEVEVNKEEQVLFINTINQNCEQLLKLVNDILNLSRMESGKMSFSIEKYNLTDLMNEIYSTHQMMMPKNLEFLKTLPEVPVITYTDKTRLKQVITNFINNAIKFTPTGHIRIGYELNPVNNTITLFVEDTGKGIPEEHKKKIFERFYKQDDFDQGTGLGLSICTIIAEKLGGHLALTSEINKGSCFAIVLPYNKKSSNRQFF